MRRLLILLSLFIAIVTAASGVSAQGISADISSDSHTAREETEGKEIWKKMQDKKLQCAKLTDDNFEALGEYFMGQMAGESHEGMNTMMIGMMGEKGEQEMHVVMGKRLSGCNTSGQFPQGISGFMMPMIGMMQMMGSAGSPQVGGGGNPMMEYGNLNNMMGGVNGFGFLGWLPMLLFWLLLILGVVALIRYLGGFGTRNNEKQSPLDILKERYARGEIDKKEFEEKKRELS